MSLRFRVWMTVAGVLVVLGGAGFMAFTMIRNRPPAPIQPRVITPTGVRVQEITLRDVPLSVTSQGTVRPRTESQLVSEIAGRVMWVAPSFAVGGFFEVGDVIIRIDPFDYQQAIIGARSQLAQARLRLAQEEAEAEVAVREWDALGRGDPRALTLREPQLEDARASVAGAEAGLERAQRDLERAEIVAPYAGRVREKNVDIGQFVRVGDAVASIYAVDFAEVRLPLPDDQLAYLDLPLSYRGENDQLKPRVTLRATFAGEAHEWQGRIVRTESEIDPVSRMVHAVVEVADPYGPGPNRRRPPLAVGMYVEAEIVGRTARNVAVVPRAALRGLDQVLVVDAADRLRFREVDILRATTDSVYVRRGLADGDLVVVSPLDSPTEGMRVQPTDADGDLLARRRGGAPTEEPAVTSDAAIPPVAEASAPASVSDRASATSAPAATDSDIDPSPNRDEQIAAIRRQIAALVGSSAATPARTTPDVSPDRPPPAPPRLADAEPGATGGRPDTTAGTRGRRGAGARDAPGDGLGRGGRGARGRGGRSDRPPPTGATPSATPVAELESDTGPPPAERTAGLAARPASIADAAPGVVVLPFVNVSRNPADDGISTDITVALRTALEQTEAVGVVTLAAADESTALETARGHGARWLVAGGYQRVGDRLRITARVLVVVGGDLVRAVKVDGAVDELDVLTAELVSTVRAEITGGENAPRTTAARDRVRRPEAGAGDLRPPATDIPPAVVGDAAPGGTATTTLAVLPFEDFSPNGDVPNVDLGAALTAALTARLAELSVVTVVSSDDGAAWIVAGGVQRVGDVVRITARLVDVENGSVLLKTVKVDGAIDALAELQARVASALIESVRGALSAVDAADGQGANAEATGAVGRRS